MVLYVWEPDKNVWRKACFSDYSEVVYALTSLVRPGRVTTYGSLARLLGVSPRLIGRIMASNKTPIIIPCHRVVKSNRELGGYSRGGGNVKKKLLMLEGVVFSSDGRVEQDYIIDLKDLLDP